MAAKKAGKGKNGTPTAAKKARSPAARRYTSAAWERVYLLSVELDALSQELGLPDRDEESEGFDLADAARELGRLALNHNRESNPDGRTAEQEKDDWIKVGGVGADLGNMADEGAVGRAAEAVRAIAHELCYLACDYLF